MWWFIGLSLVSYMFFCNWVEEGKLRKRRLHLNKTHAKYKLLLTFKRFGMNVNPYREIHAISIDDLELITELLND